MRAANYCFGGNSPASFRAPSLSRAASWAEKISGGSPDASKIGRKLALTFAQHLEEARVHSIAQASTSPGNTA